MEADWENILGRSLQEALAGRAGPVPGAKFRQIVAKVAEADNVQFPPPGMGRFSAFLEKFPRKVLIQRTPGRDIMVVPASEPERLSDDRGGFSRLRPDFFKALTHFSADSGSHFYDPSTDDVVTIAPESADHPPASAVPLPPASREREFALRETFLQSEEVPEEAREALDRALRDQRPLPSFNEAIKRFGLARTWHVFRMTDLVKRLREWAESNSLTWQPTWFGESPVSQDRQSPIPAQKLQRDLGALIHALAGQVTESDLARISVPLDIVLKLLHSDRG